MVDSFPDSKASSDTAVPFVCASDNPTAGFDFNGEEGAATNMAGVGVFTPDSVVDGETAMAGSSLGLSLRTVSMQMALRRHLLRLVNYHEYDQWTIIGG